MWKLGKVNFLFRRSFGILFRKHRTQIVSKREGTEMTVPLSLYISAVSLALSWTNVFFPAYLLPPILEIE